MAILHGMRAMGGYKSGNETIVLPISMRREGCCAEPQLRWSTAAPHSVCYVTHDKHGGARRARPLSRFVHPDYPIAL